MSAPVTTSTLTSQDFFSTTLSSSITAADTVIPLNTVPSGTEGFLTIDQDNGSREIIYYTSKGASSVTCPSASTGRGQGGTTAVSHGSGATVKMNVVSQYLTEIQNGHALGAGSVVPANLVASTGTSWGWQSYTPTWTAASGTPAIGNGTLTGRYIQIGKFVTFQIGLLAGSGTTYGTGSWSFSLPVTAAAAQNTGAFAVLPIGTCTVQDATNSPTGPVNLKTTTTIQAWTVQTLAGTNPVNTTAAVVGSSGPITWAATCKLVLSGSYEAA